MDLFTCPYDLVFKPLSSLVLPVSIADVYPIILLIGFLILGLGFFLGWISVIWQVVEEILEKLKRKKK